MKTTGTNSCTCGKPAAPGRRACNACRWLARCERRPAWVAFCKLRSNAKRRGKAFSLTFADFVSFAARTAYLDRRGRSRTSFHIDRIRPAEGYHLANIQVLTNRENVLKQRVESCWNPETRRMDFTTVYTSPEPNDCPF